MLQANPVFTGIRRGLLVPEAGTAQRTYFACLVLQAAALAIWWPKSSLADVLAAEQGPQPLLAVIVALGLTTAYYSIRAGAEEFLLPGQQSLHEWVSGTPLSIGRILRGSVLGHLAHTLYLLMFSLPLICVAFTVGGGEWATLVLSLCTVVVQAMFFWLAGAAVYLRVGHRGDAAFFAIRTLLVVVYAVAAWLAPAASHVMVSLDSLGTGTYAIGDFAAQPALQIFLLIHAVTIAVLVGVLYALLRRHRIAGAKLQSGGKVKDRG
jgi:hypothetical protein